MVVYPRVRCAVVRSKLVAIARAMPLICSPASHHLHLRAARSIKVVCLAEGVNLEFLDRFDRCGDDARSHRTRLITSETRKVLNISNRVTGHIVGVVAAINRESILVHVTAADVSSRGYARLQAQQGGRVAAQIGQQLKVFQIDRIADRGIR
jgi:hypothetical protein